MKTVGGGGSTGDVSKENQVLNNKTLKVSKKLGRIEDQGVLNAELRERQFHYGWKTKYK